MECPHCNQEIPGKECANCGSNIPEESLYCMNCGAVIKVREEVAEKPIDDVFDPENRILCSDGRCTGIIVNNRCCECGKPFKGKR